MRRTKEKILVTGSTGFFGRHLTKKLEKEGHEIYTFMGDLTDGGQVKRQVHKFLPTTIYHLGGIVDLSRSFDIAKKCIEINIKGTLHLLEALREHKPIRFIYTSSEEVYGAGSLPYSEEQMPNPPSPYAISKIAAEQLAKLYAQELGFSLFIFRIGTAYGPKQPDSRLIPQIIIKALKGEDIPLNSGTKKRDYIYIGDAIEVMTLPLEKNIEKQIAIINAGGGKQYSLKHLVDIVLRLTKSKSKVLFGAFPDRLFEADEWLLDNTRAKELLSWEPETSLEKGLKKMIDYYKNRVALD